MKCNQLISASGLFVAIGLLHSCSTKPQDFVVNYTETEKIPVIDTYFDQEVVDNYRWLEDDRSAETEDWCHTKCYYAPDTTDLIGVCSQV